MLGMTGEFGHFYEYRKFMLINTLDMDEVDWQGFKVCIKSSLDLEESDHQYTDKNMECLGKQNLEDCGDIYYGVDSTGWFPCLFAELMDEEEHENSCGEE